MKLHILPRFGDFHLKDLNRGRIKDFFADKTLDGCAKSSMVLAIVAVLFSLIGAFYYLRVVKVMYFDAPGEESPLVAEMDMRVLVSLNGLAVALFGVFPDYLMFLCNTVLAMSFGT